MAQHSCPTAERPPSAPSTWRVVAVSIQGTSHANRDEPCQDAHAWDILPGQVLVAAVADGAGSCEQGGLGAQTAAAAAIKAARDLAPPEWPNDKPAWQALLQAILARALEEVLWAAAVRNKSPRDLSCTLIISIATPHAVAAAQIGDGAAIALDSEAAATGLTLPVLGEYLNETTFLVSPNAIQTAQIHFSPTPVAGLALLSDGLQGLALKLPEATPHEGFFRPLYQFARTAHPDQSNAELTRLLNSPRVTARTDDDLTLLLAVRA